MLRPPFESARQVHARRVAFVSEVAYHPALVETPTDSPVATTKAGSTLTIEDGVLTFRVPPIRRLIGNASPRVVQIPLGRAIVETNDQGNAWIYDGPGNLVEMTMPLWPLDALEAIKAAVDAAQDQYETFEVQGQPEVQVKTYRSASEYERDAASMVSSGWRPEATASGGRGKVNMGRTVLKAGVWLPWAVMRPSRKGDPLTVTWVRERSTTTQRRVAAEASALAPPQPAPDVLVQLEKLGQLRDSGIVTEEEFEAKKADLLSRL